MKMSKALLWKKTKVNTGVFINKIIDFFLAIFTKQNIHNAKIRIGYFLLGIIFVIGLTYVFPALEQFTVPREKSDEEVNLYCTNHSYMPLADAFWPEDCPPIPECPEIPECICEDCQPYQDRIAEYDDWNSTVNYKLRRVELRCQFQTAPAQCELTNPSEDVLDYCFWVSGKEYQNKYKYTEVCKKTCATLAPSSIKRVFFGTFPDDARAQLQKPENCEVEDIIELT